MKLLCAVIALTLCSHGAHALEMNLDPNIHPVHLDLTTEEYRQLWHNRLQLLGQEKLNELEQELEPESAEAIAAGEKLSLWLKKINENRAPDLQIRLTSPGTRRGIPIDKPSVYGPKQITETLGELKKSLPAEFTAVVYGKAPISENFPGTETEFIESARKADKLYQTATRWTTAVKPWLSYYKSAKANDVRGYYYLSKMPDLDSKLQNLNSLPAEEQTLIKGHLIGLCRNARLSFAECNNSLTTSVSRGGVLSYKDRYWSKSKSIWDTFFKLSSKRSDVDWSAANPDRMVVPFVDPKNNRIADFLKLNTEDEFKFGPWRLEMDFVARSSGTAYLEFQPNVTPHVSGGNVIVMDANSPIEEYEVQWTIRHEYGHILRLPDCYVEFYDDEVESVVNYQLDTTDLMCSRAGNMNERIYLELKKNYFKN